MTAFGRYLETVLAQGRREAHEEGSATVEAQHLLLAIAAGREAATHQVLSSAGLDRRAVRDALDREFEHSLATAGVSLADFDLPRPSRPPERPTHLGTSVRLALQRGVASAPHRRDLRPAHLLLGILRAEVGTVPRALALAGVDRAELMARVLETLTDEGE